MVDRISEERRSWNMSRIRSRDTEPELILRKALHRAGYRYRLRSALPGRPDLVLPRHRAAIFVHGCFWHRHKRCEFAYTPKSRIEFWQRKFDSNVARDLRVQRELRRLGLKVIVVWECEIRRDVSVTLSRIGRRLRAAPLG
jgi:DNA mismatch endonuclease, patch repair protein